MSYKSNITASVLQYLDQNIDSDNVTNGEVGSDDQVHIVEAWWRQTFPDIFQDCLSVDLTSIQSQLLIYILIIGMFKSS